MKTTKIHIKSKQIDHEGNENSMEFYAEGQWQRKDSALYVTYKETEVSGMEGAVTTIRLYSDKATLLRFGDYGMKLDFKEGTLSRSLYKTPYGNIEMLVDTKAISVDIGEEEAFVYLQYVLEIDQQEKLLNELSVRFRL